MIEKLKPAENVLWEEVEGEVVLLKLDEGKSFRLNRTGGRVWRGIVEKSSLEQIAAGLSDRLTINGYNVNDDLEQFISELIEEKLVVVDG